MNTALNIHRTFTNWDLRNFYYGSTLGRYDLSGFSHREAWILQAILPLYAAGAALLQVNLAALVELAERGAGHGYSERTTRSAIEDLEKRGLVRRRRYRHGGCLKIDLLDSLAEYLGRDKLKRIPKTIPHKTTPAMFAGGSSERDRSTPIVRSDPLVFNSNKQPCTPAPAPVDIDPSVSKPARDRCDEKTKPNKPERHDPIVYSIRCVCPGKLRPVLTAIANREIKQGGGHSGIDWAYWRSRWAGMGIDQREYHAREILPALISALRNPHPIERAQNIVDTIQSVTAGVCETQKNETAEIVSGALLEKITNSIAGTAGTAGTGRPVAPEFPAEIPADPDERILWEAAINARRRRADLDRWDRESSLATLEQDCFETRTRAEHSRQTPGPSGAGCES